jgi:hypothetical protein
VLTVEDWAEIRRLHFAERLGKQTIAKRLGVARNTVKDAIKRNDPPAYRRPRRGSAVDPFEPQIRELPSLFLRERTSRTPSTRRSERQPLRSGLRRRRQKTTTLLRVRRRARPRHRAPLMRMPILSTPLV